MHQTSYDLAIVGAGPAGIALAASATKLGARVAVVDPEPDRAWTQTWCMFADEAPDLPVRHRWERAVVQLPSGRRRLERPYVEVDTAAFHAGLRARSSGAAFLKARAEQRSDGVLHTSEGAIAARHIVDASGGRQVLGRRGPAPGAFQTAYGMEVETTGHPWPVDEALWMDLVDLQDPPSFLYVLPTSSSRVFVEETVLAGRPPVAIDLLRRRLDERLRGLGVGVREVLREERCSIPLDVPRPAGLAFGTAAQMVHPATGYLLARTLGAADGFARALLADEPCRAMASIRSSTQGLHRYGLDVLTSCDGRELTAFFEAFFAQPDWAVRAFLSSTPRLGPTSASMLRMFATSPVKSLLVRPLLRPAASVESPCPPC